MRKIERISVPNYAEKEFVIENYSKLCQSSENMFLSKNGLKEILFAEQTEISLPSDNVKSIFFVSGKLLAFIENDGVYQWYNNSWRKVLQTSDLQYVTRIKQLGDNCVLIKGSSSTGARINSSNKVESVYSLAGSKTAIFNEIFFLSSGNRLNFSEPFVHNNFDSGINQGGQLTTDSFYGEIVSLKALKDKLVIICERAIYTLSCSSERENFHLQKEDVSVNVQKNTIEQVNDIIFMVSDGDLIKYQNGKIKKLETSFDLSNYEFFSQSGIDVDEYYILIKSKTTGKNFIFSYNAITEQEKLYSVENPLLADQGYIADQGVIKKILNNKTIVVDRSWKSVKLDFGKPQKKALTQIVIRTDCDLEVEVVGDYCKKILIFNRGLSRKKLNMESTAFEVNIKCLTEKVDIGKIKFIYRLKED